ncbi:MAG TPA: ribosome-associated translation inhibitor RaiA [Caldithrix abyssi]|uniref:Ribosome hibernation promoting factor n=1 Tax=Caldithrix abyssi TaxID=187145 RepID=A0A7V4WTB0_CALAY|nr:ribosome-associated translation inhibitor RaiA [Caldithrix abyssi]
MNIAITTRGYKAPARLKNYLQDKLKRLDRFANRIMGVEAILSYEKKDQVVEFKLKTPHKMIIVKEKSEDVFKSIDLAIDNLERQLAKIKEKIKEHDKVKMVENLVS